MYDCRQTLHELNAMGIDVRVYQGIFPLIPDRDGFLFWLPKDEKIDFRLQVVTVRDPGIKVITVEGQHKHIQGRTDQTPEEALATYERIISTDEIIDALPEKEYSTKPGNHNLRIVVVRNGQFELWEAAIVTFVRASEERAEYHLAIQRTYSAKLYRRAGKFFVRRAEYRNFDQWDDLHKLLKKMVNIESLEEFEGSDEVSEDTADPSLGDTQARVLFFNLSKLWGFGITNSRVAMLHWSQIARNDGEFPMFETGELIQFEKLEETGENRFQIIGARQVMERAV